MAKIKLSDLKQSETLELKAEIELLKKGKAKAEADVVSMQEKVEQARWSNRPNRKCPKPKNIRKDKIRVGVGDVHGSFIDWQAVGAFLGDMERLQPDEIILGGDLIDCGGFLAQHHTLGFVAQADYTYEADIASGNDFLDRLQEACPNAVIYYLEGNHELRVEKWCVTQALRNKADADFLRRAVGIEQCLGLEKRGIQFFRSGEFYHGCRSRGTIKLGPTSIPCYYTHGISCSVHAAAAHVRKFASNIVYFHTHRRDMYTINTVAKSGIGAYNPGCLCQFQPLYQTTRVDDWSHGYNLQMVAKSGLFQSINVLIVDGKSLLMPILEG